MKKITSLVSVFLLTFALLSALAVLPAAAQSPRLVDGAELLTGAEKARLTEKLDRISTELGYDIVVVTTQDRGNCSIMSFADDFYDMNDYCADGVLLAIDMSDRSWHICTTGKGEDKIGSAWSSIGDTILSDLKYGNYYAAFSSFADECESYISYVPTFPVGQYLLISFGAALVIALIVTGVMKSRLTSVSMQTGAADYVRENSMKLTVSRDIFLYRTVSRVAKPKDTSSSSGHHTSSSGHSHGGGGGHF